MYGGCDQQEQEKNGELNYEGKKGNNSFDKKMKRKLLKNAVGLQ